MKRANIKDHNQDYRNFILIENMNDMIDFRHEKTYGLMKGSARELVDRVQLKDTEHATDVIVVSVEKLQKIKQKGVIYKHAELMGGYMSKQDEAILDGKTIVINPYNMVSYFTLSDNAEIEIVSEKEKYTIKDIRLNRWVDGIHWYAKISEIDVVVDGEQKWGAKWVAQQKAEEFLKTL